MLLPFDLMAGVIALFSTIEQMLSPYFVCISGG